jgi:signal transduction histidine kinase
VSGPARGGDEIARLTGHVDAHLDRIEKLLRAQREISDDIAHELRTPLVHLDSRLLKALDRNADREVGEELERARADIRSVVSLFDALLDIALAESAGGSGTLRQEIDLSEVAGDVAELYQASAEEAGITFTTRIAPDVQLRGEAMQLARLIANLLDNAFKYAPRGSRVRLSVSPGPRILVEDDGPGVPPEDAERIFQRFLRGGTKANGHGLGLALVTVIAARHGLAARVESAAPGARFVVEPVGAA